MKQTLISNHFIIKNLEKLPQTPTKPIETDLNNITKTSNKAPKRKPYETKTSKKPPFFLSDS